MRILDVINEVAKLFDQVVQQRLMQRIYGGGRQILNKNQLEGAIVCRALPYHLDCSFQNYVSSDPYQNQFEA